MAGLEVERKWLIDSVGSLPIEVVGAPADEIEQGYLTIGADGSETRVRRRAGQCTLTVKSGSGLVRRETEISLTAEQFEVLWPATENARIQKSRRAVRGEGGVSGGGRVPGEGGVRGAAGLAAAGGVPSAGGVSVGAVTIEVDVYSGALEGLVVAEVEFDDPWGAESFIPPYWFGREVTAESAYKNRSLALHGRPG